MDCNVSWVFNLFKYNKIKCCWLIILSLSLLQPSSQPLPSYMWRLHSNWILIGSWRVMDCLHSKPRPFRYKAVGSRQKRYFRTDSEERRVSKHFIIKFVMKLFVVVSLSALLINNTASSESYLGWFFLFHCFQDGLSDVFSFSFSSLSLTFTLLLHLSKSNMFREHKLVACSLIFFRAVPT